METLSKSEAMDLLKTMFKEVGVVSTWKWDDALRNVKSDSRYKFLNFSMQDKK